SEARPLALVVERGLEEFDQSSASFFAEQGVLVTGRSDAHRLPSVDELDRAPRLTLGLEERRESQVFGAVGASLERSPHRILGRSGERSIVARVRAEDLCVASIAFMAGTNELGEASPLLDGLVVTSHLEQLLTERHASVRVAGL